MITFFFILASFAMILTIIFSIHAGRFRKRLSAIHDLQELGRLVSIKRNVLIDDAFLQKKLHSLLKSKGMFIKLNKKFVIILYVNSAFFILSLGVWIASAYPEKLSMSAPFFDKETHDAIQRWTIIYGLALLGLIFNYILRGQRIKYYSSIIDKFKELGMEESGT